MKKILSNGKVIVSCISVIAILAVSLLSMFTGVSFMAAAEGEDDSTVVKYPISGEYDADYKEVKEPGITYEAVDTKKKTKVDNFTGFDETFCINPDTKGNGTAASPYIIETANQFAAVVTGTLKDANDDWMDTEGLCFKIADNIKGFNLNNTGSTVDFSKDDLGAAAVEAELAGATVIDGLDWHNDSNKPFKGRFDGNGAQVYGLKGDGGYTAIFPKIGGNITVKNLTVKNCYFKGSNVSAFFGANTNGNPGTGVINTKHFMFNCQAYGNVVVCTFDTNEAIQKAGILIGQTEYPTESNLVVNDCLVYGNVAKHATRAITYGIVGNLHRTGSLTINNSIIMDSAPHALYYGSNAHLTSTYNNLYTNKMGIEPWENTDNYQNGDPVKYVYSYTINSGTPTVGFNHFDKNGVNLTNNGDGYLRELKTSVVHLKSADEIKESQDLNGIDTARWTYNKNGYPTPKIYKIREYSANTPWSGEVAVQFSEGDGSEKAPYCVSTAEEFALMLMSGEAGKYYKLTADIKINDTSAEDWTKTAKKWFTSNDIPVFQASLDGNGHTVSGIYYDGKQKGENVGLIPIVGNTANITNLTVTNSVINANIGYAGAVAGSIAEKCSKLVKFYSIKVEDSVKFEGRAKFGGIIGHVGYSVLSLTDSISKSKGLFYEVKGEAKVKRCVSVGAYPFADTTRVMAENIYTDTEGAVAFEGVTVVPNDAMLGEAAKDSMPGLNFPESWVTTDSYPLPTGATLSANGIVGEPWSGAVASDYAGGSGTQEEPYLIETPEQLAKLCSTRYRPGGGMENVKYYKLTADIYINDVTSSLWAEKIGCLDWFSQWVNGVYITNSHINFDGDGHVIFGLYYDHTQGAIEYVRVGLFPVLCEYSTIQNVGLSDVYFAGTTDNPGVTDTIGGFVGCTEDFDKFLALDSHDAAGNLEKLQNPDNGYEDMALKFKNCFIDHRSYISGFYTGGFIAVPSASVILENCVFTGALGGHADPYYTGALTGADSSYGTQLRYCLSSPVTPAVSIVGGSNGASWRSSANYQVIFTKAMYYFSTKMSYGGIFNRLSNPNDRIGEQAKEKMPDFDWDNTWRTVDGGTPIQQIFDTKHNAEYVEAKRVKIDNADYFSLTDFTPPSTIITFETNAPEIDPVEPMEAPMYSELKPLPIITRPGYEFLGWYVFDDPAIPYDFGYHPPRDLTLYAGWKQVGVVQNFDEYPNSIWDIDANYWTLNQPGAKGGYLNKYVRNGNKSMHLLGATSNSVDCLLNYEQMLEPGKSYTLTFWVNTDKADNPATLLSLVHNSKPDYLNSSVAVENIAVVTGLKVDEWVQYSYSFTAQTKWVSLRATGAASLWFDDVVMAELDAPLTTSNITAKASTADISGGTLAPKTSNTVAIAVIISVVMACAVVAVVSKKDRNEVVED